LRCRRLAGVPGAGAALQRDRDPRLFALSLDLILGYAGIVSLGHAAFFGIGAYCRGVAGQALESGPVARHGGCGRRRDRARLLTSFLILRGSDLTRLMVTLGVASILYELANQLDWLTGGADGLQGVTIGALKTPFGAFEFDIAGRVAFGYSAVMLVACLLLVRPARPFAVRLLAAGAARQPAACREHRPAGERAPRRRLHAGRGDRRRGRGPAGADQRLRLARRVRFPSQRRGAAGARHRRHRLPLGRPVRAIAFKLLRDAISAWTPQYWNFWLGLFLVVLVLVGRDRLVRPWTGWRR
jgi:branched-chain amino acid transport system permease protein